MNRHETTEDTTSAAGADRPSGRRRLMCRRVGAGLVAAFTLATAAGIDAGSASALTTSATGYAGSVAAPVTIGYGGGLSNTVLAQNRTVTESAAYGRYDQYACAEYRLWRLGTRNGAQVWNHVTSATRCAWIPAASTSVTLAGVTFNAPGGYGYSIDVNHSWKLSNGAVVGTRYVDYAHRADFACGNYNCSTGTSTVGGYVMPNF